MPGRGNPRVRPSGHQVDRRSVSTDSGYAKAAPKSARAGDFEPADLLPGHPDNPENAVISQAIHADSQVSPHDQHRKIDPDGGSEARDDDPRCRWNGLRGSGPAQRAPNERRRSRPPPPLWRRNAHPRQASHVSSEADRSRALVDNGQMSEAAVTATVAGTVVNEQAWRDPAPGLRGLVDSYIGFRQAGVEPARHRGLPSPSLTLIYTLDDPIVLAAHPDPAQPPGIYETVLGGLHTAPAIITHEGQQSGIQLGLSPLGARALLGVPASELAEIDVPAEEVLGRLSSELHDRLRTAPGWPERFAVLDEVLLGRVAQLGGPSDNGAAVNPEVSYAWRRLVRSGGVVSVRDLAAETGWSDRHLRARFRGEIGLAPKAAARVIRFDRVKRVLHRRAAAGEALCLADVAAACGYFDQGHLDREFALLAGCSPTRWLAEEFRNIQATAA